MPPTALPPRTVNAVTAASIPDGDANGDDDGRKFWSAAEHLLPDLPQKLTPSQAARISEVLDFLHRGLGSALENLRPKEEGAEIVVPLGDWQKVQAVQLLLARYLRWVAEPRTVDNE